MVAHARVISTYAYVHVTGPGSQEVSHEIYDIHLSFKSTDDGSKHLILLVK